MPHGDESGTVIANLERIVPPAWFRRGLLGLLVLAATSPAVADASSDSRRLVVDGEPFESPLLPAGHASHYVFRASGQQTYLVQVEQVGLDFVIELGGPEGTESTYDSPLARDEGEVILIENAAAGDYRINLVSTELTAAEGRHAIRVVAIPAGTSPEYLAALRKFTAGAAAWAIDDWSEKERALEAYESAVPAAERSGHPAEWAYALYAAAFLEYWVSYDNPAAVRNALKAADIYRNELGDQKLYANALLLSAAAMLENLQFDEALSAAEQVLSLHQISGNEYDTARTEELIGYAYHRKGELDASIEYRRRAADRFGGLGEWFKALTPRARMAIIEADKGYTNRAIDTLEEINGRLSAAADPFFVGEVLDGLGDAYRLNGNLNDALIHYDAAIEQHRRNGDVHAEAGTLRGIGLTYLASGHLELAASFLNEALETATGSNIEIRERALTALGTIEYLRGNYQQSLALHRQALQRLNQAASPADAEAQALSGTNLAYRLILIARDLAALEQYEAARTQLVDARSQLADVDSPFHLAAIDQEMGKAWVNENQFEAGIAALKAALATYRSVGSQEGQAAVAHELARAYGRQGDYETAIQYGAESIQYIESVRAQIAKPELRALFTESRRSYYDSQVALLLEFQATSEQSGDALLSHALTVTERGRARMTMDLIAEASIDLRRGIDPSLRARQRDLRDQLAARVYQLETPGESTRQTLDEMAEIEHALTIVENEIRLDNPLFIGLSAPDTLSADSMRQLLDPGDVLLQYALGVERSYVWVVTRDSVRGVALANGAAIEGAARQLNAALRTYPSDATELAASLSALSKLVVLPVQSMLDGERIVVVADGELHYVPFQVLPVDPGDPRQPLVTTHEVVTVPSMSVLASLRQGPGQNEPARESPEGIAVLADPVFSELDPRLPARPTGQIVLLSNAEGASDRLAQSRFTEEMGLERLPGTEQEARLIEDLVPAGQRLVARGFEANRANATSPGLRQYRYLHFATHATVDTRYPALSRLFLTNFTPDGQYSSGTLLLDDIYNLDLNADLVVLSACDTALGLEIRGEGLVGFTQGFLFAGARSLVMSLWPVPDRATAELMSRFYRILLDGDSTATPVKALQLAQSSMAAERRWRDPYLWAAFVLVGDWR